MRILVTSTSAIKAKAVQKFFADRSGSPVDMTLIDCTGCGLPAQPVAIKECDGFCFAKGRFNYARGLDEDFEDFDAYDFVVSIENVLWGTNDICYTLIYSKGLIGFGQSFAIHCPADMSNQSLIGCDRLQGYATTAGELLHCQDASIDPKNWMLSVATIDRCDQIIDGLAMADKDLTANIAIKDKLIATFKLYTDYPKPGVIFEDIFAVLADAESQNALIDLIVAQYRYDRLTKIVGLESRGLMLALAVAYALKVASWPVRKVDKLPGERGDGPGQIASVAYGTEYSKDVVEMRKFICPEDERVLVLDDVVATGGSADAALQLLKGCVIADCLVLRQVLNLRAKCRAKLGRSYTVLLQ